MFAGLLRGRRAAPRDAATIARIHVETWRAAYSHVFPTAFLAGLSVSERTERWSEYLAADDADIFVAEVEGRLTGCVAAGPARGADAPGAAEVYAIYVLPDAWGNGVGRALLTQAEWALLKRGFDEATLWVLEDNPRARRFYEAAGWGTDEARDVYSRGGVDAPDIRYRKKLKRLDVDQ